MMGINVRPLPYVSKPSLKSTGPLKGNHLQQFRSSLRNHASNTQLASMK